MRAFQFNLQRVLSYRETVEDALMTELAAITSEHEREVARLEHIRRTRDSFRVGMKEKLAEGDPEVIRRAHGYLTALSERVADQKETVRQIGLKKEEKTAEVVEASKERQVLDKLKEIKATEHRRETQGEEQKFLDEVAGTRHQAKQV